MIALSPVPFSTDRLGKVHFDQDTNSSDRQNNDDKQQSSNLTYGREKLRSSRSFRDTDQFGYSLPELSEALRNLYDGRLKADIANSSSSINLMSNSDLISERVLHFTSKQ
jgi:hypothetical protein